MIPIVSFSDIVCLQRYKNKYECNCHIKCLHGDGCNKSGSDQQAHRNHVMKIHAAEDAEVSLAEHPVLQRMASVILTRATVYFL